MAFKKTMYGEDLDGNRGFEIIEYDDSDLETEEVLDKLYDYFINGEYLGTKTISIYVDILDDYINVDVNIQDYLKTLIERAENDQEFKDDVDIQDYILEVKEYIESLKNKDIDFSM